MVKFELVEGNVSKSVEGPNGFRDFKRIGIPVKKSAEGKKDVFFLNDVDQDFLNKNPHLPLLNVVESFYCEDERALYTGVVSYLQLENTAYQQPNFNQYMSGSSNTSERYVLRIHFQLDEVKGSFRIEYKGRNYVASSKMASIMDSHSDDELAELIEEYTLITNGIELHEDDESLVRVFVQEPSGKIIDVEVEIKEILDHIVGFEVLEFEISIDD